MFKKINKYELLELICIFVLTLFFNLVCLTIDLDEIWNYGFSFNIASGLIPYKDFNMVITPLFPIIVGTIMALTSKSIIILHIINAIICTFIFKYMKKNYPKCYYIPYGIFLFFSLPNYNLLCLLLLYIIIDIDRNKTNDYLVGLLIGIVFITKQNIGVYLLIPALLTNIKSIKKISKRILGFIIPIIVLFIYLLLNNNLYEFIDYCFLGMKEFATKNLDINYVYLIILVIGIVYSIIRFFQTKENKYLYLLFYSLIAFPIIQSYHVILSFIPVFGFILNELNLNKRIINIAFIIFISIIFTFNIYNIYTHKYNYPNETTAYKYRKILPVDAQSIVKVSKYITSINDRLYFLSSTAYTVELENKVPPNKYNLLNDGNLGLNGETKLINEIKNTCAKEKCTFIIDMTDIYDTKSAQFNKNIPKYIMDNYQEYGSIYNYTLKVYKNY